MTPVIHIERSPWKKWVVAGLLLLWAFALWGMRSEASEVPIFLWSGLMLALVTNFVVNGRDPALILVDHVLVVRDGPSIQRVLLAAAEIEDLKKGWQIRWRDGRIPRRIALNTPTAFREAVERAVEVARRADPDTVPQTPAEAAAAVVLAYHARTGLPVPALLAVMIALAVIGTWFRQPLLLLPLPVVVAFSDRLFWGGSDVVLAGQHLWLISPRQEVYGIPLRAVRSVRPAGRWTSSFLIETEDPTYPILRVYPHGGEAAFAGHLKRRLAGEPPVPPRRRDEGPADTDATPHAAALRCSLCGRAVPGAVAGIGVFICERCSARARHEANEAGHGLTGKEPRPI